MASFVLGLPLGFQQVSLALKMKLRPKEGVLVSHQKWTNISKGARGLTRRGVGGPGLGHLRLHVRLLAPAGEGPELEAKVG